MSQQLRIDGGEDAADPTDGHTWQVPHRPSQAEWDRLVEHVVHVLDVKDREDFAPSTARIRTELFVRLAVMADHFQVLGALRRLLAVGMVASTAGADFDRAGPIGTIETTLSGRAVPFWHLTDRGRAWVHRAGESGAR